MNIIDTIKAKKESIKLWQSICKHNGAIISNTGTDGSKCALCGKILYPNNPNTKI